MGAQNENTGRSIEHIIMTDEGRLSATEDMIVYTAYSFVKILITMTSPKKANTVVANAPMIAVADLLIILTALLADFTRSKTALTIGINTTMPNVAENDIQNAASTTAKGEIISMAAPANDKFVNVSDLKESIIDK